MDQIRHIEQLFTVDTEKLKAITEHFISELAKGMFLLLNSHCHLYGLN